MPDAAAAPIVPPQQRARYRPTGRVAWSAFVPFAALVLVVAAGLAVLLHLAFVHGYYYVVLTPALAILPLTGLVALVVGLGRCRSRALGAAFGVAAGLVTYLGHFHAGLVSVAGIEHLHRIDVLPDYIRWRMETMVQSDSGRPGDAEQEPTPGLNWFCFALEAGLAVWLCGIAGAGRAARAYCEQCGAWKRRSLAFFAPGSAPRVLELLETGRLAELGQLPRLTRDPQNRKYTALGAEYCPPPPGLPPGVPGFFAVKCPVFLSVKEVKHGGGYGAGMMFDWSIGRMKAPRLELTRPEVADLVPLFPPLAALAPVPLANGQRPVSLGDEEELDRGAPATLASIAEVPPPPGGRVLTGGAIAIGNVVGLTGLALFLGSAALGVWGLWRMGKELDAGRADSPEAIVGYVAIGVGAVTGIFTAYSALRNPSLFGNRYLRRRAGAKLGARPDRVVDPTHPAAEFVEVVPRANWGATMLETATDVGFLLLDPRSRQVLFEGDRERWRIPAAAVLHAGAEPATEAQGTLGEVQHHMCILHVSTPGGPRELSFCRRQTEWRLPKDHRQRSAEDLRQRIVALAQ